METFIFAPVMNKSLLTLIAISALTACNNAHDNNGGQHVKQFPKPGTVVASAEIPIAEDKLNHFSFSVKVVADSNISAGVYDVDADFGPNFAEGQFTMPKGGEDLKPVIRRGSQPYTFVIGFQIAGDTTFYDYYEVTSDHNATKMQYLKAYTF